MIGVKEYEVENSVVICVIYALVNTCIFKVLGIQSIAEPNASITKLLF